MLFISNFYDKYLIYAKYILILFLFWISINTGSKYVIFDNLYLNFTENSFNFLRSILPYLILIYLIIFEKDILKKINLKFDYFFIFFGLYGFFQTLGLLYQFNNLYEHYWIVCLFAVLLFFNLVRNKQNDKLINTIFIANIILILIVFCIFIFITFKENFFSEHLLYHSRSFSIIYNTEQLPRSSGLSRMALILFIFTNSLYLFKFRKKTYLLFLNTVLISIILLLQSRGAILSLILIFPLFLINFKIEDKVKYFFFIIIFPIIIFISYPNVKNFFIEKFGSSDIVYNDPKTIKLKNLEINFRADLIGSDIHGEKNFSEKVVSLSNNRISAWNFLIQIFLNNELDDNIKNDLINANYKIELFQKIKRKNLLTGYGPQADRHMMYNKNIIGEAPTILGPYGYNASNGIIYSLITSGIIGLICFIIINLIIFFKIVKILFYHFKFENLNSKPILATSIFSVLFLQFRSLFENSYSVFGVDLLILMTAYLVIQSEYRKLRN
jgi:hypothetical protein